MQNWKQFPGNMDPRLQRLNGAQNISKFVWKCAVFNCLPTNPSYLLGGLPN